MRRRPLRDIDPETIDQWETTRVTFLGDAVHAMNPWIGIGLFVLHHEFCVRINTLCLPNFFSLGTSNALTNLDEVNWKKNIWKYELGLRGRGSYLRESIKRRMS